MEIAVEKQIITPTEPVFMAGFGARTHKSEGVLDQLFAKVVLLRDNRCLLLISLDVLGGDRGFSEGVKTALQQQFGFRHDEIIINFTHTHASVFLTGELPGERRGNYSMGQESWPNNPDAIDYTVDVQYYHKLKAQIIRMTEQCFASLRPGKLTFASGLSNIAVQRRKMTELGMRWSPNYAAKIDQELVLLKLTDESDHVQAVLFAIGCHPTSMNHTIGKISAEFVGEACRQVEEHYPGITAVFLQGCAGDLKPLQTAQGDRFISCTVDEMRKAGGSLADDCVRILQDSPFRAIQGPFQTIIRETWLQTDICDPAQLEKQALTDHRGDFYRNAAKRLLHLIQNGEEKSQLPISLTMWRLDEQTYVIALENEIPTGYALMIKQLFPELKLIILGYSNAVYSYIPTSTILQEGGYEADHPLTTGFRGRFAQDTEERILSMVKSGMESFGGDLRGRGYAALKRE